jgi:L-alanine-DL-glutamate epimerase-like enolase superfamily enzyme
MATPRVSAIETVLHDDYPHVIHVLVHTDDGQVGLGESFHHPHAIAEYIHTVIAPRLIGEPASNIANAWRLMGNFTDGQQPFSGTITIESSATSAIDIALWDLRSKILGLPLHEALGGAVRDRIRVYNTCAEAGHLPPEGTPFHRRHEYEDWGIGGPRSTQYDDWQATLERPGELARELVDSGITAMKIYPFSPYIRETRGLYITPKQLDEGLEVFRAIRASVGNQIDIAVDMSFVWAHAPALKIASALDEFGLIWIEDLTRTSSVKAMASIAKVIRTPLAGFDYRVGLPAVIDLVEAGAVSIVRMDLQWVGGPTEAIRIAGYAEARGLGTILHDCTGPVQWATAIHCSLRIPNAMIQESVRAYYKLVYPTMVKRVPQVVDGYALALDGPGHGAELLPGYIAGGRTRRSTVKDDQFVTGMVA